MPVIKSAIKKMRQDKKREIENNVLRVKIDRAIREAKKTKTAKTVSSAVSLVDKGVKKNLLPKNRAARIKSSLSKLSKPAAKGSAPKTETVKKTTTKTAPKTKKTSTKKSSKK
jgi:small subunit ribosomal protein S20